MNEFLESQLSQITTETIELEIEVLKSEHILSDLKRRYAESVGKFTSTQLILNKFIDFNKD